MVTKTILVILLLALAGCAATPPTPKSTAQSVAIVEATITAGYKTVSDLELSKSLTAEQATRILNILDTAKGDLLAARTALNSAIPDDAVSRLVLINNLLIQYQQELIKAEAGK